jgi:hypothetical protein
MEMRCWCLPQGSGDQAAAVPDWLRYLCGRGAGRRRQAAVLSVAKREDPGGVRRQEARTAGAAAI